MIKTYKYKLRLTKAQSNTIDSWIGACRVVYNLGLEIKIDAYRKTKKSVHKFELMKQLAPLRKDVKWIMDTPAMCLQNSIERLDAAYQKFFKGSGFPKWAKKHSYNSVNFKKVHSFSGNTILLPKIGEVKIFKDRMPDGELKIATVIKERNAYYICVTFESQSKNLYPTNENQVVGIDMGISCFSVDSNSRFVENPQHTKVYENRLRVKNRELARKKKGSVKFIQTKKELNKLHHKIANVRKDFLHNESLNYVKNNSLIVCEDLKVKNMVKNHNLAKHISDASWSKYFSMLQYKSAFYEKEFIQINPKHTSQKCSCCGHTSPENRTTQAIFECVKCGYKANADYNAAKNILGEGIALKRKREAVACALLLEPQSEVCQNRKVLDNG